MKVLHFPCLCRPIIPSVSHSFHFSVTQEVLSLISKGNPTPDDITATPDTSGSPNTKRSTISEDGGMTKKLAIETSHGDVRLWVEILRNLTKDLPKHQSIQLPDAVLTGLHANQSKLGKEEEESAFQAQASSNEHQQQNPLVAFTCGHAYSLDRFQNRILLEFVERVQDFPMPIPQTLKLLQNHYKQSQCYPSACPHCVFQFLRKIQMEECPKVPIRPWKL